jgi:hypothetical protein
MTSLWSLPTTMKKGIGYAILVHLHGGNFIRDVVESMNVLQNYIVMIMKRGMSSAAPNFSGKPPLLTFAKLEAYTREVTLKKIKFAT